MKKVIILSALLGFVLVSQAQTFEDAVQFSRTQNWGTARSAGMAGAFGALGGDLSTLSSNRCFQEIGSLYYTQFKFCQHQGYRL
mgnify:CR=1 FL=1